MTIAIILLLHIYLIAFVISAFQNYYIFYIMLLGFPLSNLFYFRLYGQWLEHIYSLFVPGLEFSN